MSVSLERELRNLIKTGTYYLGARQTLKAVLNGRAKLVIVAENTPPHYKKRLEYYARLSGVPIIEFKGTSVDLGLAAGKPFKVSMIAVIDEGSSRILELAE
ncbi:MAG: 50S ribosomal protein L30e [Desulfurococcales archaeon]|nr:50S ribosomal protein L30e [Desulfurococcales archaeon]